MPASIPVHGGLSEPVDRTIPESEVKDLLKFAGERKRITIGNGDLSILNRIGDGTLSPLTGFMDQTTFNRVLDEERILRDGKAYAWTIPLSLPVSEQDAKAIKPGETVALVSESGAVVGALKVSDLFKFDKVKYNEQVYGTPRTDHPGARIALEDPRGFLLGGEVRVLPQPGRPDYGQYLLTPRQTRALFAEKKWERILAFQTRNPLHRAHEYALVAGMERLTREGHFTGVVLNPLVGETKSDDVDARTRMRCYRALVEKRLLGQGDKDEALWRSKGYDLTDQFLLIALDIKMFYAGPKEAIMHAVYRQNLGFTDIVIGRRHADAPFDDRTPIWGDFDAQEKFKNLSGELLIQSCNIGFAAYYEELGRVGLVDEHGHKGWKMVSISGSALREMFRKGEVPDERVIRREISEILIESYRSRDRA
jgi:sulfate adenylyltransferase